MGLLTALHRWAGATIGLILIVTGLSGIVLVWEEYWICLPGADDPVTASAASLAHAVEAASTHHEGLSRITFASSEIGLHLAIYIDGSGAYLDQRGMVVDHWAGGWGRPELWIFDLHHYLLAGEAGELFVGIAGIAGILFVLSGAILWWRTRRTFALRLWPRRVSRSAIVRHHRDVGIIAAPFLLLVLLTGSAMIFKPISAAIVAALPAPSSQEAVLDERLAPNDWQSAFRFAQRTFPDADIRRLQFSGTRATLRLRQPFEWTPNGRTYLELNEVGAIRIDAPDGSVNKQSISEKIYPIHAGKVGGLAWKASLTLTGLALVILGALACFSFWCLRSSVQMNASNG